MFVISMYVIFKKILIQTTDNINEYYLLDNNSNKFYSISEYHLTILFNNLNILRLIMNFVERIMIIVQISIELN
jgi:hypothetical protein